MSFGIKKTINTSLRGIGVKTFDAAAVNALAEYIEKDGSDGALKDFMRVWKSDGFQGDRLTTEAVQAALAELRGGGQSLELCAIINAFDVPKISYDPVGRKLYADGKPRTIFAPALAKQQLYIDRLQLINQRIRRSSLFQPRSLANGTDIRSPQLTDIQSLKGIVGVRRFVIGCISRSEDGRYLLEDGSGTIPLNLSEVQTAAGFYTENCIVIAEGAMQLDGAFHAAALGFPPCEPREGLPMAAQRLNFFGGPPLSGEDEANLMGEELDHEGDRVVILSDVHLDRREVLNGLKTIFDGYNDMPEVPTLFVLMGNFHSRAGSVGMRSAAVAAAAAGAGLDYVSMRDNFDSLAALIDQYPRIKAETRFVFIPGPGDPSPGTALPQPPIPAYFTGELRRVLPTAVFASNPCRVRYLSQQIVFFRYDILKRMRRRCLIPPKDAGDWLAAGASLGTQAAPTAASDPGCSGGGTHANAKAMWGHLALTLLQQSHLCPLPLVLQPIYWQYDHALQLYPLPNAVVVADSSPQAEHSHEGCKVFNPGSFSEGMFAAYKPCSGIVENSEIPQDGYTGYAEEEEEEEEEEEAPAYLDDAGGSQGDDLPQVDQAHANVVVSPMEKSDLGRDVDDEEEDQADDASRAVKRRAALDRPDAAGVTDGRTDQEIWDAIVVEDGEDRSCPEVSASADNEMQE